MNAQEKRIILVACAGTKLQQPAPARDLYISQLFRESRAYAEREGTRWCILSAKHGLVQPETIIEPYDVTLAAMKAPAREVWALKVYCQLAQAGLSPAYGIVFLAGLHYRSSLEKLLLADGYFISAPLCGKGIGEQIQWLQRQNQKIARPSEQWV